MEEDKINVALLLIFVSIGGLSMIVFKQYLIGVIVLLVGFILSNNH